ncbi:MAG: polysaccharide biosynthesis/export family protein [Deltaproteobacteria bacterium]|nr:polysaccharide biosynthesis/export family protein [Desulfitobacteriaceae bacterium]MDI6855030.1 polysaccharide biosynthesis/export family protein [Deltaproteobacteria bacterium]
MPEHRLLSSPYSALCAPTRPGLDAPPAPKPHFALKAAILWTWVLALLLCLASPAPAQDDYVLGPEDEIEIRVWDHDDLTRKLRIGLEGRFSYPFIGEVKAQGLTVLQLQKELERRLADGYIIDPHVSVTITDFKSRKFFVVGNVARPGAYPLTKNITVVEAVSLAGGLATAGGKPAPTGTAIIVRAQPGEKPDNPRLPDQARPQDKVAVSLNAALAGDPRHNVAINNGDTVYVPTLVFYVTGEVKKPGRYPYEEGLTVLQAVTTAEGFSDKASPRRTHIIREQGQSKQKIDVNLDDPVRPGDTVVVPEAWF